MLAITNIKDALKPLPFECNAYSLGFSTLRVADARSKGKIVQTDIIEEAQTGIQLFQYLVTIICSLSERTGLSPRSSAEIH